jgi:hypothetical protein
MNAYLCEFLARQRFEDLLAEAERDRIVRGVEQPGRPRMARNSRVGRILCMIHLAMDDMALRLRVLLKTPPRGAVRGRSPDRLRPCV